MRTTVTIDDCILQDVKVQSSKSGKTLGEFFEEALGEKLLRQRKIAPAAYHPPLVSDRNGGVLPGIDLDNNAQLIEMMDAWDAADRR